MNDVRRFVTLVVFGVGLPVGLVFMVSLAYFPWTTYAIDVDNGMKTFKKKCSVCHALESNATPKFGPNLFNIGQIAEARRPGRTAEQYILESVLEPNAFQAPGTEGGMPQEISTDLSKAEIRNLVAFLAGQGRPRDFRALDRLIIDQKQRSDRRNDFKPLSTFEKGFHIFRDIARCESCHSIDPVPGGNFIAPSLAQVGLHSEEYIRESILNPSLKITPTYQRVQIRMNSGEIIAGRRFEQTVSQIKILHQDRNGHYELKVIPLSQISITSNGMPDIEAHPNSLMPSFQFSKEDLDALIHFLKLFTGSRKGE